MKSHLIPAPAARHGLDLQPLPAMSDGLASATAKVTTGLDTGAPAAPSHASEGVSEMPVARETAESVDDSAASSLAPMLWIFGFLAFVLALGIWNG